MKHFYALLLSLAIPAISAWGQNVIVVMKDGLSHKFNADYVSEIKFVESSTVKVEFTELYADPHKGGEVNLTFYGNNDQVICSLNVYGPSDAAWMHAGSYAVDDSKGEFTINQDKSSVIIDGQSLQVTSGAMEVGVEGSIHTFCLELGLSDGSQLSGTYSGEINGYSQIIETKIVNAVYNENERPAGHFYILMNNADWKVNIALDIIADEKSQVLPAGKYVYSAEGGIGTFGPKSYLDTYSPYSSNRMVEGSEFDVKVEGENYSIEMNLKLEDGRAAHAVFNGKINGTPKFE